MLCCGSDGSLVDEAMDMEPIDMVSWVTEPCVEATSGMETYVVAVDMEHWDTGHMNSGSSVPLRFASRPDLSDRRLTSD